ncbi:MAG: adenosylcobinamide-GDP ribazoletransferase [Acidobacteriota bacterium]
MIRSLLIAVQFLTRLPVSGSLVASQEEIAKSVGFFPLIGIAIGSVGALLYTGLIQFLPVTTSVLLVLIYSALVTGGFHEDGLADSLDGLGGGWTKEDKLRIMRDSRIGTFGTLGLIFLILAKYNLLSMLEWSRLWRWLIVAHAASRWTTIPLCIWLPYARKQGQGGLVARRIRWQEAVIATLTLLIASLLLPYREILFALTITIGVVLISGFYYRRQLNGITGDCLGATNQLTEVALYFTSVVLSRVWTTI